MDIISTVRPRSNPSSNTIDEVVPCTVREKDKARRCRIDR
ncbi:unnamed protein product [Rhodiola kirilowii]